VFSSKTRNEKNGSLTLVEGGRARGNNRAVSMLAEGCLFEGKLFLQGESRVGGKVDGMLVSDGHLTIEESAVLKGEVSGVSIFLNGIVEGKIRASEILHISSTGRVRGELQAKRLIVDDGARVEGKMSSLEASPADTQQLNQNQKTKAAG
jgi:cytoskeletal protein CcmA (bactofilin family)